MSYDYSLVEPIKEILTFLSIYKDADFSITELESKLNMDKTKVRQCIDEMQKAGYVQENFTTNLLDPDGKSRIAYKITYTGMQYYLNIMSTKDSSSSDFDNEEKAKKKFNRKVMIFCAISFAIAIIAVILTSILNS